jgi:hypothetical protein
MHSLAEVVELADTRGLGPRGIKSLAGSIPVLGIYLKNEKMFKKLIKPIQNRLLKKKQCPGCTHELKKTDALAEISNTKKLVMCKCNRIYVYDLETDTYRRATLDEEQYFLTKGRK